MRALLAFLVALSLSWSTTATARVERLELHVSETLTLPTRAKGYDAKESSHPSTGRFLSLDPVAGSLSDPLSTQGFTYAHANPTRFTDPDGRVANGVAAIIGGVVGGVAGCALGAWHAKAGDGWTECGLGAGVGAVSGAIAGLTFGASLAAQGVTTAATATGAQLATAGLASGALSGGVGAGLGTAVHGGSAEQVIQNAAVGTLVGGIGGFVGGGLFGAVAPSLTTGAQRFAGGALSSLGGDLAAQTTNSFLTGADFDPLQAGLATGLGGAFANLGRQKSTRRSSKQRHSGVLRNVNYDVDAEVDAWASYIYDEIRTSGLRDVDLVSRNTGIDVAKIRTTKRHMMFDVHDIPVMNDETQIVSMTRTRFAADLDVAEAWVKARSGPLKPKQQAWFEKLVAHEVAEEAHEAAGVPHRDPTSWDPIREAWGVGDGAHDRANRIAPQPPAGFPDD